MKLRFLLISIAIALISVGVLASGPHYDDPGGGGVPGVTGDGSTVTVSSDLVLPDDKKAYLGTGLDFWCYYNSSSTMVECRNIYAIQFQIADGGQNIVFLGTMNIGGLMLVSGSVQLNGDYALKRTSSTELKFPADGHLQILKSGGTVGALLDADTAGTLLLKRHDGTDNLNLTIGGIFTGSTDCSGGTAELPNATTLPATCSAGMIFLDTDSDDCADTGGGDGALCLCKTTDTWVLLNNI